jgi:hypothetical protein
VNIYNSNCVCAKLKQKAIFSKLNSEKKAGEMSVSLKGFSSLQLSSDYRPPSLTHLQT